MRKSEHLLPIYHCSTLGIPIYLYLHLKLVACINDNGYFKCLCYPITLIQGKQNTDTINTFFKGVLSYLQLNSKLICIFSKSCLYIQNKCYFEKG